MLETFGVNVNKYEINNQKIYNDFSKILKLDKRKRKNRAFGIASASFSILSTTLGIVTLSKKNKKELGKSINNGIGGMFLGVGIVSGGFSIRLFNSSKKRQKERDKLIKKYI